MLKIKQLVADARMKLDRRVRGFSRFCEWMKLLENIRKSLVVKYAKNYLGGRIEVEFNNEVLEKVESFKYLRSTIVVGRERN